MPNFRGERCGVITRISERASPHEPLYSTRSGATHIEALAVRYDAQRFAHDFLADWPAGSPAHQSYWSRIDSGTALTIAAAMPRPAGQAQASAACRAATG